MPRARTSPALSSSALNSPDIDPRVAAGFVMRALRGWRRARDRRVAVQPYLFRMLKGPSASLAPVFDSLFRFYEAALNRPLAVGNGQGFSEDEDLLLSLIGRPDLCETRLTCTKGIALGFNSALCSTRIMMARALGPDSGRLAPA